MRLKEANDQFDGMVLGLGENGREFEGLQAAASPSEDEDNDSTKVNDDPESIALEEYLSSRLQHIGEISSERKEAKGLRTGNGWDAAQLIEYVYKIDPVPIKRAIELAISSNRRLREKIADSLMRRKSEIKLIGTPTVEFVPIWKIIGFHECYYLRTNTYKIKVNEDVVGVEVEGKSRDLILEKKHRNFVPSLIFERLQRLGGFLTSESKYFLVNEVTELARTRSDGELVVSSSGKKLSQDDELALTSWRSKRIFDKTELKVKGANIHVRESAISRETLLEKFREQVIRMPERFKQILSNRLQVTELKRIYVPLIRIPIQKGLVPREVVVNGTSGELADNNLLESFE
jgi:hypothetical protein